MTKEQFQATGAQIGDKVIITITTDNVKMPLVLEAKDITDIVETADDITLFHNQDAYAVSKISKLEQI